MKVKAFIISAVMLALPFSGGLNTTLMAKSQSGQAAEFTLLDTSGKQVSLTDFKGKVVVLNFWATWCAPCLREMPGLEKIYQNYKEQGVAVVGVAIVSKSEDIPRQARKASVNYPILIGNKEIIAAYKNFYSIPQTFIIGRDGRIRKQFSGMLNYAAFEKEVASLLK